MNFRKCEICGLRSGRKDGTKRAFMARFPLDEVRCKIWVKMTGNEDLACIPIKKLHELKFICGKHFKEEYFNKKKTRLNVAAVPSLALSARPLSDDVLVEFPCKVYKEQYSSEEGNEENNNFSCTTSLKSNSRVPNDHTFNKVSSTTPEPSSSSVFADLKPSGICNEIKLEVCIDSLESAINAIQGGADELEVCSSLVEGGLTPSAGLVKEIMQLVKNVDVSEATVNNEIPKVNVMIRCRGGSDFCYSKNEIDTMIADIEIFKSFGVDRFVFGALTKEQEVDKVNCIKILNSAHPVPVTFHRAYDLCKKPEAAMEDIIDLGFKRLLTSGQKPSAADKKALDLLNLLFKKYNDKIEIMPGAGINCYNAKVFVKAGFTIIHSSCKKTKLLPDFGGDLKMGSNEMYVTDENIVKKIKKKLKIK